MIAREHGSGLWAVGITLMIGLLATVIFAIVYTERAHGFIVVLNCTLLLAIASIRPVNQTVRWFRIFLLFFFGIFPLWQLLAGDEIYLKLLPQDSVAVMLWFFLSIGGVLVVQLMLIARRRELAPWFRVVRPVMRVGGLAYLFACLSLSALAFMYVKLGGYSHIAQLYDTRVESNGTDYDPFRGLGVIQALANTSPLWVFVCLMLRRRRNVLITTIAFVQLGVLGWLSSGVAGSRQGIVFVLVFALFIYHEFVNRINPRKARLFGIAVALTGILLIPLKLGLGYSDLAKLPQRFAEQRGLELSMGPLSSFFFRDLSRFDVQILAIDTVEKPSFELAMGRSFVGAVASVVPSALWGDRPDTFAKEKSDIVRNVERTTMEKTTLLFGMPGEFLVNFGIVGYMLSFVIPAMLLVLHNRIGRKAERWLPLRAVIWPIPFLFFLFDSNVIVYYVVRWVLLFGLPMAYALQSSRQSRAMPQAEIASEPAAAS
ncbi:hypothetical protein [Burkholderia sp. A9]|uniref:hypothetical protein n=1 Tax=Burkholderia sp. A9 TaxID=1365108 RepID=UPI001F332490|nr:hypothetical protein [Burkholderia sp. A9]